jgi:predicted transposase YbfD/YdcC
MKDPRRTSKGNFKHSMLEILFLSISANLCGITEYKLTNMWGKAHIDWLRNYYPYKDGVPSPDTISRFFNAIDPETFNKHFVLFANEIKQNIVNEHIAIDGKAVRSNNKRAKKERSLHIVTAFSSDNSLSIAQALVEEKSNEMTAIYEVLDMILLRNAVITIDAIACQDLLIDKITNDKQCDFIIAVKGNQKHALEEIRQRFEGTETKNSSISKEENSKGTLTRTCESMTGMKDLKLQKKWPMVKSIVKQSNERVDKESGEVNKEVRYFISSLGDTDNEQFAKYIQAHWSVENKLHWTLDVVFKEDETKKRKANGIVNYNILTKVVLQGMTRYREKNLDKGRRKSYKDIQFLCNSNPDLRTELLSYIS